MPEQRRIGFRWHLRQVMAAHNLWKSVNGGRELTPLRRVGSTRGQFSDDADRNQPSSARCCGRAASTSPMPGLSPRHRRAATDPVTHVRCLVRHL